MKAYINPYILKLIEDAVKDEASDFMIFARLSEEYPEKAEMFAGIASDEIKHKKMLEELYADLSGKTLVQPRLEQIEKLPSRAELMRDKFDTVAMYRTVFFALPSASAANKNILFEIMTDEMMHAAALSSINRDKA